MTDKGKGSKGKSGSKDPEEKEAQPRDFWERVADDVAAGYESKEDEDKILNIDQEPGDEERGDKPDDE